MSKSEPEQHDETGRDADGRFKPGTSGNPGGRPSGVSVTAAIRAALKEPTIDDAGTPMTVAERLAAIIVKRAVAGDWRFVSMLLDRVEGPVDRRTIISTDPGTPIFISEMADAKLQAMVDLAASETTACAACSCKAEQ